MNSGAISRGQKCRQELSSYGWWQGHRPRNPVRAASPPGVRAASLATIVSTRPQQPHLLFDDAADWLMALRRHTEVPTAMHAPPATAAVNSRLARVPLLMASPCPEELGSPCMLPLGRPGSSGSE